MLAETVDDITIEYKEGEDILVKELEKAILAKGGPWVTMMFKYQNWDANKEEFGPEMISIRRFQKKGGEYKLKSKFNITNIEQAKKVIEILSQWTQE